MRNNMWQACYLHFRSSVVFCDNMFLITECTLITRNVSFTSAYMKCKLTCVTISSTAPLCSTYHKKIKKKKKTGAAIQSDMFCIVVYEMRASTLGIKWGQTSAQRALKTTPCYFWRSPFSSDSDSKELTPLQAPVWCNANTTKQPTVRQSLKWFPTDVDGDHHVVPNKK